MEYKTLKVGIQQDFQTIRAEDLLSFILDFWNKYV